MVGSFVIILSPFSFVITYSKFIGNSTTHAPFSSITLPTLNVSKTGKPLSSLLNDCLIANISPGPLSNPHKLPKSSFGLQFERILLLDAVLNIDPINIAVGCISILTSSLKSKSTLFMDESQVSIFPHNGEMFKPFDMDTICGNEFKSVDF